MKVREMVRKLGLREDEEEAMVWSRSVKEMWLKVIMSTAVVVALIMSTVVVVMRGVFGWVGPCSC